MQPGRLERRDFHKLTLAAFGGVLAGTLPGCDSGNAPKTGSTPPKSTGDGKTVAAAPQDKHLCHGLNSCKDKGASGKNDCAGQGTCATITHACAQANECKGQGGCGNDPGENTCKGQGSCTVPLMDDAWKKVRGRLEADLKKAGKTAGPDPKAKS